MEIAYMWNERERERDGMETENQQTTSDGMRCIKAKVKRAKAAEAARNIFAVYGENVVGERTARNGFPRKHFAETMLAQVEDNDTLLSRMCFSDEATFHVSGKGNRHNCRIWRSENPRVVIEYERDSHKWNTVTVNTYLDMLQLYAEPYLPGGTISQHDGAPPHFANVVRTFLGEHIPASWIGRGSPYILWPARSPDLTPSDFILCAAQQLNASQSTHRFSFVNHTIKTVNMPKVRHSVNLKSKLTSYISEFKEDGLSTDNKILFCNLCQCAVSSTQKFLVQQHITTSKHQANKQLNSKQRQLFLTQPTTSNVRSEFNIDLCRSLISADIPLYKLKNKVFREFLEKYTQHTIPDESTLRKTYAPSIYDETIQKIRDEIKDSSIWVSIDETPDKEGRLVGNVVIGLLSEQYSERILLHCDVLEKCNNKTIVKLFNEAMGILDAAPYMVKAGQALSVVYPKLTHFTCVAHAFHRVAEVVRDNFLK
ncbi:hypothetical protein ANN_23712 [Periplaneta americana]|uniref:DUF659 domain-containing protein n=1 Tax=Periplaneta americana TaxID=6978 RepID=A0ABQ8SMY0_PERAM|nr:hypothetical protein ANN_23712 [Periplaneta americana]